MRISAVLSLTMAMVTLMGGTEGTNRPIVGILAQELPWILRVFGRTSFVPASYVEAVEASGARAVPIFINQTMDYYRHMMTSINGVVFPGGGTDFTAPHGYAAAGRIIMDIAQQLQDSGVSIPILGVCQGFQLLMYLSANSTSEGYILVGCNATDVALPLDFRPGFNRSSLFKRASDEIIEILQNLPVTSNHHRISRGRSSYPSLPPSVTPLPVA
ncbi:hypothetical protein J6590_004616 [Homalodisca vitripennis]|nr:hypothetical protein J6590_004616 [Homalodisca vitripennis]